MNTTKIQIFSVCQLIIGEVNFELSTFDDMDDSKNEIIKLGEQVEGVRKIGKKVSSDERFVHIFFEEGSKNPHPETVFNIGLKGEEENPRSDQQIERDVQFFALIDIQTQKIYLSNLKRRAEFESFLRKVTNKNVFIKSIIDKEDFLDNLSSVDSIKFSASPKMFSELGDLNAMLVNDKFNYGAGIKQVELDIKFQPNGFPNIMKEKIKNLFQQKSNQAIDKLVISGKSDEKIERVFNTDGIVDKIAISIITKKDGLLDSDNVFSQLIATIKEKHDK